MSTKIAFIGLGIMGSRMAQNLITGGAEVTVYNRSAEAMGPFVGVANEVAKLGFKFGRRKLVVRQSKF